MAPNSASLLFSTPSTRKSAVQAVVFCFKRQTTGHLEHSGKCTMPPTPPVYVCKIEHLRLPLTFGWMCALPEREREQRWGQQTLSRHPCLYFPEPALYSLLTIFLTRHALQYNALCCLLNIFCCKLWSKRVSLHFIWHILFSWHFFRDMWNQQGET